MRYARGVDFFSEGSSQVIDYGLVMFSWLSPLHDGVPIGGSWRFVIHWLYDPLSQQSFSPMVC